MKTTDKKGKGESTENLDEKRKLALEIIENEDGSKTLKVNNLK